MDTPQSTAARTTAARKTGLALGAALALTLTVYGVSIATAATDVEFHDARAQAQEFLGYYKAIQLTPEQEAVKKEALTALPAPCCSNNTAYTCCCPCNMAKTVWGLANWLIADKGYDAPRVTATVQRWFEFINPDGFAGNTCSTGGCMRPWAQGGCAGMRDELIF